MPELPEVEAARRLVEKYCIGGVILEATVADDAKVIEGISSSSLEESLKSKRILAASRKGKHLWLELDQQPWPSFHFGMTGAVLIKGVKGPQYKSSALKDEDVWPSKFSKVHIKLDTGVEMSFTDKRRFARVRHLPDPSAVPPISELGSDAFTNLPDEGHFGTAVQSKKTSIKSLLLDQSFLAGIGNWVADEVLYQAKIHPEQTAASLSDEDCKHLRASIQEVLETAVKVDADSQQFPEHWLFHHRWARKPGSLNGNQIELITVNGRTSAFVPAVQKYSGPDLPVRRKAGGKKTSPKKDSASESQEGEGSKGKTRRKGKQSITSEAAVEVVKPATIRTRHKADASSAVAIPVESIRQGRPKSTDSTPEQAAKNKSLQNVGASNPADISAGRLGDEVLPPRRASKRHGTAAGGMTGSQQETKQAKVSHGRKLQLLIREARK